MIESKNSDIVDVIKKQHETLEKYIETCLQIQKAVEVTIDDGGIPSESKVLMEEVRREIELNSQLHYENGMLMTVEEKATKTKTLELHRHNHRTPNDIRKEIEVKTNCLLMNFEKLDLSRVVSHFGEYSGMSEVNHQQMKERRDDDLGLKQLHVKLLCLLIKQKQDRIQLKTSHQERGKENRPTPAAKI